MKLGEPRRRAVETAARKDVRECGLRRLRARPRVLRDVAERPAAQHQAGGRVVLAGEHLEQAGLAGAVPADEADLVPRGDGEARVRQHPLRHDVDGEVSDLEHGDRMLRSGAAGVS